MTELVRIVQEATETAVRKSSVRPMRTFICIRCRQAFDHNKPGRRPWRCKECIRAVEVERIQLRNISDRIKRLDCVIRCAVTAGPRWYLMTRAPDDA